MPGRLGWIAFFLCAACGGDPVECDRCVPDAGAAMDGGVRADAGPPPDPDAGPGCVTDPIAPEVYDCEASEPGITFGEPIAAPDLTWTFVPFEDALCMNGSSTGIGVNLSPSSDRLVIYLDGGGACFDDVSCFGAANGNGFDAGDFAFIMNGLSSGIFDRDDEDNPVRDASFVFVPYCSGDVHGGTNEDGYEGRTHFGYRNVTEYLERLVPTFADRELSMVLLTGRSAGGLGSLVNFEQVQRAFDCVPVHAFDDAGAVLPDAYLRPCLQSLVRGLWGLDAIIPGECAQCTCENGGGLVNVYPYLARRYPDRRFGLASAVADATFRTFYGYGYSQFCNFPAGVPAEDYEAGLNEVRTLMADDENFRTFYVEGDRHTFSESPLGSVSVDGTTLGDWLRQLVDGDPGWTDVGP